MKYHSDIIVNYSSNGSYNLYINDNTIKLIKPYISIIYVKLLIYLIKNIPPILNIVNTSILNDILIII